MINALLIRIGWYLRRKDDGHPISLWRALFSHLPQFSAYERNETGCPDWALDAYKAVDILSNYRYN